MRTALIPLLATTLWACDASDPNDDIQVQGRYTLTVDGFGTQTGRARGEVGNNGIDFEDYRRISDVSLIDLPTVDFPTADGVTVNVGLSSVPGTVGRYGIAPEESDGCVPTGSGTGPGAEVLASLYAAPASSTARCRAVLLGGTVDVLAAEDDDVRVRFEVVGLSNAPGVLPDTLRVSGMVTLGAAAR